MAKKRKADRIFHGSRNDYECFRRAVPHHDAFQQKVANLVRKKIVEPGMMTDTVLCELGVGTGVTLSFVIEETENLKEVSRLDAVDNSPYMLADRKKRFLDPRVDAINMDIIEFLPSHAFEYDGIYSVYTIHNMQQEEQIELFRLAYHSLKKGGCLVDGDMFAYSDRKIQERVFDWQIRMYERNVADPQKQLWIEHILEDSKIYFTLEMLVPILERIGFAVRIAYREKLEAVILARKI